MSEKPVHSALVKKVVFVAEVLPFVGQRFSESLPEKSCDSNPAVVSVVSVSTGLGFFLGCPFFLFVGVSPVFTEKFRVRIV
jgi:hypothetical protein